MGRRTRGPHDSRCCSTHTIPSGAAAPAARSIGTAPPRSPRRAALSSRAASDRKTWPRPSPAFDRSASTYRRASRRAPASRTTAGCDYCSRPCMPTITRRDPDSRGYFGEFGGRYVPETLVEPVEQLERAYLAAREDARFAGELARLLKDYVGRPTPISDA